MQENTKNILLNYIININGGLQNAQHNIDSLQEWVKSQEAEDTPKVISDLYNIRELIHKAVKMWEDKQHGDDFPLGEFDDVMFELSQHLQEYSDEGVSGEITYCNECGTEVAKEDQRWYSRAPFPTESTNEGESTVLCPECADTKERLLSEGHYDSPGFHVRRLDWEDHTTWGVYDQDGDGYGLFRTREEAEHVATHLEDPEHDITGVTYVNMKGEPVDELNEETHGTSGGVDLTNEVLEELADEAEQGYEPTKLSQRPEYPSVEEPDEWFLEDYEGEDYDRLRKHVETSQTWTIFHDHSEGEECGDCEHWYVPEDEIVDSGAEGSRFWTMGLTEGSWDDLIASAKDRKFIGLVDEEAGGIVAYVFEGYEEEMYKVLREASSKPSTEDVVLHLCDDECEDPNHPHDGLVYTEQSLTERPAWKDRAVYLEEIIRTCINHLGDEQLVGPMGSVQVMLKETIEGLEVGHHSEPLVTWTDMRHLPWEDWDGQKEKSLRLHLASEHGFLPEVMGGHDDWVLLGDSDLSAVESLHADDHSDYPEGGGGHIKHDHPTGPDMFSDSGLIQFSVTSESEAEVERLLQEINDLKKRINGLASNASNKAFLGINNVESMKLDNTKRLSENWISVHRNETQTLANYRDRAKHHLKEAREAIEKIKEVTK